MTAVWLDRVIVDRLVEGRPPGERRPTPVEVQAAISRLDTYGFSSREIADRLRMSTGHVQRVRRTLRDRNHTHA